MLKKNLNSVLAATNTAPFIPLIEHNTFNEHTSLLCFIDSTFCHFLLQPIVEDTWCSTCTSFHLVVLSAQLISCFQQTLSPCSSLLPASCWQPGISIRSSSTPVSPKHIHPAQSREANLLPLCTAPEIPPVPVHLCTKGPLCLFNVGPPYRYLTESCLYFSVQMFTSKLDSGFQGATLTLHRGTLQAIGGGKPRNVGNGRTALPRLLTKEFIHLEGKYFLK